MRTNLIMTKLILIMLMLPCISLQAQKPPIIPLPVDMNMLDGTFEISSETSLVFDQSNENLIQIAGFMNNFLKEHYQMELSETDDGKNVIRLKINPGEEMGYEGYVLKVNENGVQIKSASPNGIFYGIQTLKQMLQPSTSSKLSIPFVEIKDQPRFAWRGAMLDVGRHFFPVSYIKKFLDYMAMYKLNTFHWHLTEDQGWRIEIKKYPRLTEISHWRDETIVGHARKSTTYDGIGYGGFYTQEQIREIVQYAADRYITVVPEIEMPGHSTAALAAYPELGCTGGPYEVKKTWGVMKDVYCAGKQETFEFLQNILDEVCELFPSTYIHIGGDECPKDRWETCPDCQKKIQDEGLNDEHELQSYFIRRIEKHLVSKNKKLIGWDEILEGGLAPEATVMSWRGETGGIEAAKQGHDVVMTPDTYCYFDHYQNQDKENEPLAIGGYLPLDKVYNYEPVSDVFSNEEANHILGVQGNIWTEYIASIKKLEYMAFPRICALSEVAWSAKGAKDLVGFQQRMKTEYIRLKKYGINYCDHSE